MTNREARGILANLEADYRDLDPLVLTNDSIQLVNKRIEALGIAISALQEQELKQESSLTQKGLDTVSRQAAIDALINHESTSTLAIINVIDKDVARAIIEELPSAQPQYTELTPEEAASEIASGSIMSASYWLDAMIRLKQMGYVMCREKG